MRKAKRAALDGRGAIGKETVIGAKQRGGAVTAAHVPDAGRGTIRPFIEGRIAAGATLYSDDGAAVEDIPDRLSRLRHEAVNHSAGEYVRGMARPNASSRSGPCSSAASTASITACPPSAFDAASRNSPGVIMSGTRTRGRKWPPRAAWTENRRLGKELTA